MSTCGHNFANGLAGLCLTCGLQAKVRVLESAVKQVAQLTGPCDDKIDPCDHTMCMEIRRCRDALSVAAML